MNLAPPLSSVAQLASLVLTKLLAPTRLTSHQLQHRIQAILRSARSHPTKQSLFQWLLYSLTKKIQGTQLHVDRSQKLSLHELSTVLMSLQQLNMQSCQLISIVSSLIQPNITALVSDRKEFIEFVTALARHFVKSVIAGRIMEIDLLLTLSQHIIGKLPLLLIVFQLTLVDHQKQSDVIMIMCDRIARHLDEVSLQLQRVLARCCLKRVNCLWQGSQYYCQQAFEQKGKLQRRRLKIQSRNSIELQNSLLSIGFRIDFKTMVETLVQMHEEISPPIQSFCHLFLEQLVSRQTSITHKLALQMADWYFSLSHKQVEHFRNTSELSLQQVLVMNIDSEDLTSLIRLSSSYLQSQIQSDFSNAILKNENRAVIIESVLCSPSLKVNQNSKILIRQLLSSSSILLQCLYQSLQLLANLQSFVSKWQNSVTLQNQGQLLEIAECWLTLRGHSQIPVFMDRINSKLGLKNLRFQDESALAHCFSLYSGVSLQPKFIPEIIHWLSPALIVSLFNSLQDISELAVLSTQITHQLWMQLYQQLKQLQPSSLNFIAKVTELLQREPVAAIGTHLLHKINLLPNPVGQVLYLGGKLKQRQIFYIHYKGSNIKSMLINLKSPQIKHIIPNPSTVRLQRYQSSLQLYTGDCSFRVQDTLLTKTDSEEINLKCDKKLVLEFKNMILTLIRLEDRLIMWHTLSIKTEGLSIYLSESGQTCFDFKDVSLSLARQIITIQAQPSPHYSLMQTSTWLTSTFLSTYPILVPRGLIPQLILLAQNSQTNSKYKLLRIIIKLVKISTTRQRPLPDLKEQVQSTLSRIHQIDFRVLKQLIEFTEPQCLKVLLHSIFFLLLRGRQEQVKLGLDLLQKLSTERHVVDYLFEGQFTSKIVFFIQNCKLAKHTQRLAVKKRLLYCLKIVLLLGLKEVWVEELAHLLTFLTTVVEKGSRRKYSDQFLKTEEDMHKSIHQLSSQIITIIVQALWRFNSYDHLIIPREPTIAKSILEKLYNCLKPLPRQLSYITKLMRAAYQQQDRLPQKAVSQILNIISMLEHEGIQQIIQLLSILIEKQLPQVQQQLIAMTAITLANCKNVSKLRIIRPLLQILNKTHLIPGNARLTQLSFQIFLDSGYNNLNEFLERCQSSQHLQLAFDFLTHILRRRPTKLSFICAALLNQAKLNPLLSSLSSFIQLIIQAIDTIKVCPTEKMMLPEFNFNQNSLNSSLIRPTMPALFYIVPLSLTCYSQSGSLLLAQHFYKLRTSLDYQQSQFFYWRIKSQIRRLKFTNQETRNEKIKILEGLSIFIFQEMQLDNIKFYRLISLQEIDINLKVFFLSQLNFYLQNLNIQNYELVSSNIPSHVQKLFLVQSALLYNYKSWSKSSISELNRHQAQAAPAPHNLQMHFYFQKKVSELSWKKLMKNTIKSQANLFYQQSKGQKQPVLKQKGVYDSQMRGLIFIPYSKYNYQLRESVLRIETSPKSSKQASLQIYQQLKRERTYSKNFDFSMPVVQGEEIEEQDQFYEQLLPKTNVLQLSYESHICQRVTKKGVYQGVIIVGTSQIVFYSEECDQSFEKSSAKQALIKNKKQLIIKYQDLKQIKPRRYCFGYRIAIQIYLVQGKSYYFNFYQEIRLAAFEDKFALKLKAIGIKYSSLRVTEEQMAEQTKRLISDWTKGDISNFSFLMQMNQKASRSFNDLSQYPIFPFVLNDYSSETLDLQNQTTFRKLDKPIGSLNQQRLTKLKQKVASAKKDSGVPTCLYNSHYSTPVTVSFFMIRIQPFTSTNLSIQGGGFDRADRLFSKIEVVWKNIMNSMGDFKESIPQFYYLPEFLKNESRINFGKCQSSEEIKDVQLPRWARSAEQFIFKMRSALQSQQVSRKLHHWMQLIFGMYQLDQQKLNTFRQFTYERWHRNGCLQDELKTQIFFFGQCPPMILKNCRERSSSSVYYLKSHPQPKLLVAQNQILDFRYENNKLYILAYGDQLIKARLTRDFNNERRQQIKFPRNKAISFRYFSNKIFAIGKFNTTILLSADSSKNRTKPLQVDSLIENFIINSQGVSIINRNPILLQTRNIRTILMASNKDYQVIIDQSKIMLFLNGYFMKIVAQLHKIPLKVKLGNQLIFLYFDQQIQALKYHANKLQRKNHFPNQMSETH